MKNTVPEQTYVFWVNPNIKMTEIVDSLQLDSGQTIATLQHSGWLVSLEVTGDVSVMWKGREYTKPSEFPDDLKREIDAEEDWYINKYNRDVFVGESNRFEIYVYDDKYPDSEMSIREATPEAMTNGSIFDIMYEAMFEEEEKRKSDSSTTGEYDSLFIEILTHDGWNEQEAAKIICSVPPEKRLEMSVTEWRELSDRHKNKLIQRRKMQ